MVPLNKRICASISLPKNHDWPRALSVSIPATGENDGAAVFKALKEHAKSWGEIVWAHVVWTIQHHPETIEIWRPDESPKDQSETIRNLMAEAKGAITHAVYRTHGHSPQSCSSCELIERFIG